MASMDLGHLFSSFTCYVYSYENLKVKSIFKLENPLLLCNGTLNYNKISGKKFNLSLALVLVTLCHCQYSMEGSKFMEGALSMLVQKSCYW
jgi:hypothetical protein